MEALPRFEDTDFWLDIKDVKIGPEIGKGQFSTVYAARYFGDAVAVKKQLRKQVMLEAYILRELSVLKLAHHDNIVNYIGAYNDTTHDEDGCCASYIVTELCYGGDLLRLLQNQDLNLSWKFRLRIAKQTADALHFLHTKNLVHRDIKSSNVLLDHHWNCKITDFGFARLLGDSSFNFGSNFNCNGSNGNNNNSGSDGASSSRRLTICGTEEYMAPEMLFDEEYDLSVDIFSFGVVLFELMKRQHAGKEGFLERKPRDKFEIDIDLLRTQLPTDVPESLFTLAEQCISYDPSLRPNSEAAFDWVLDIYDKTELTSDSFVTASASGSGSGSGSGGTTASAQSFVEPCSIEQNASLDASSEMQLPQLLLPPQIVFAVKQLGGKLGKPNNYDLSRSSFDTPATVGGGGGSDGGGSSFLSFKDQVVFPQGAKVASGPESLPGSCSNSYMTPSKSQLQLQHPQSRSTRVSDDSRLSQTNEIDQDELFAKHGLMESEVGGMSPTPKASRARSINFFAEAEPLVLKEGYLSKLNQTGFRNWKRMWFTLTEKKFMWKSSDPTKRSWFDLKDATIRRSARYSNRFIISQSIMNEAPVTSEASPPPENNQKSSRPTTSGSLNSAAAAAIAGALVSGAIDSTTSKSSANKSPAPDACSTDVIVDVDKKASNGSNSNNKRRSQRRSSGNNKPQSPGTKKKNELPQKQGAAVSSSHSTAVELSEPADIGTAEDRSISDTSASRASLRFHGSIANKRNSVRRRSSKAKDTPNINNSNSSGHLAAAGANGNHSSMNRSQHAVLFLRELSSNDPKETEEWFHAIEEAILDAQEDEVTEYTQINHSSSRQASLTREQQQELNASTLDAIVASRSSATASAATNTAARQALEEENSEKTMPALSLMTSQNSFKSMLQLVGVKSMYEYSDVGEWLHSIGLPAEAAASYERLFAANGYSELATIAQAGLSQADFDFLHITNPAHCRILEGAACSHFSPTLRLAINGWSRYENFFVFKVVSRWKFHRSSQYLKLSHFKKFDKALRRDLAAAEFHELLIRLPLLPVKEFGKHELQESNRLSIDFYSALRRKLETYLLSVAQVLENSPKLFVLLRFLELVHTLPQNS